MFDCFVVVPTGSLKQVVAKPKCVEQSDISIMNHDSGFIIGIAHVFAKILIEHTTKTCLKKHPQTKNNLLVVLCK